MKNKKLLISLFLVAVITSLICITTFLNVIPSGAISVYQLNSILDKNYTFLDIRTDGEYANYHIESFNKNINYYQFQNDLTMLDNLNKTIPIIIICNTGHRTNTAYSIFIDYGFSTVYDVTGGIDAYNNAYNLT